MAETLLQLTYLSARDAHMPESEIDRILSSARLHNRRNGITGLLLFNGEYFLQLIEGPAEAVEDSFIRIAQDPRHHDVRLINRVEVPFRAFSSWSMAFERIDDQAPDRRAALVAQVRSMMPNAEQRTGEHFLQVARKAA